MAQHNNDDIDVSYQLKNILSRIGKTFLKFLYTYIRYIYVLLFIIAAILLYHYTFNKKSYESKVLVIQNFESENYLYQKINEVDSKLKLNDTVYLKRVFGDHYNSISNIDIDPIDDTYSFKSKTTNSLEIYRLLSNTKEAVDNILNYQESVYFKHHEIKIKTSGNLHTEGAISNLITFLNNNEHYHEYAKIYTDNLKKEIADNEKTLNQINHILDTYNINEGNVSGKNIVNINPSLDNLVREKRILINNQLVLKVALADGTQIIKPVTFSINLQEENRIPNKIKYFILSQLLYLAFLLFMFLFKNRSNFSTYVQNINENR